MIRDLIIEEVRKACEDYAMQFDYDLDAMFDDLQRRQREGGRTTVSFPPKRRAMAKVSRDDATDRS
jgi:hypothetical protein